MGDKSAVVENLKKVTITIEAGTSPESMDITSEPADFVFIFGLGASGLTPFEYELANKHCDEEVILRIYPRDIPVIFAHLDLPFFHQQPELDSFFLKTRIEDVQPATGRELIKAMAAMAECGDGCCGNHS